MTNDVLKAKFFHFNICSRMQKVIDTREVHERLVKDHPASSALEKLAVNPWWRKYSEFKDVSHLLVLSDVL